MWIQSFTWTCQNCKQFENLPHLTTKIWGKTLKHAMLCFIARAGMKTYTVLSVNEFLRFQRNKWLQLRAIKTLNAVFLCHYYFSLYETLRVHWASGETILIWHNFIILPVSHHLSMQRTYNILKLMTEKMGKTILNQF